MKKNAISPISRMPDDDEDKWSRINAAEKMFHGDKTKMIDFNEKFEEAPTMAEKRDVFLAHIPITPRNKNRIIHDGTAPMVGERKEDDGTPKMIGERVIDDGTATMSETRTPRPTQIERLESRRFGASKGGSLNTFTERRINTSGLEFSNADILHSKSIKTLKDTHENLLKRINKSKDKEEKERLIKRILEIEKEIIAEEKKYIEERFKVKKCGGKCEIL